eukprot:395382_1
MNIISINSIIYTLSSSINSMTEISNDCFYYSIHSFSCCYISCLFMVIYNMLYWNKFLSYRNCILQTPTDFPTSNTTIQPSIDHPSETTAKNYTHLYTNICISIPFYKILYSIKSTLLLMILLMLLTHANGQTHIPTTNPTHILTNNPTFTDFPTNDPTTKPPTTYLTEFPTKYQLLSQTCTLNEVGRWYSPTHIDHLYCNSKT